MIWLRFAKLLKNGAAATCMIRLTESTDYGYGVAMEWSRFCNDLGKITGIFLWDDCPGQTDIQLKIVAQ